MAAHVDIVQSELEMSQSNCISVIEMQLDWDIFFKKGHRAFEPVGSERVSTVLKIIR